MPVSGVPDPDKHWNCMKCEQWFEADEGQLFEMERFSAAGRMADALRGGGKLRFRCNPCTQRSSSNRVKFWAIVAAVLAIAVAFKLWPAS
jgi:hypothetical protein